MNTIKSTDNENMNSIQIATAALAGAFAEGADLGPRGAHIRALGQQLETMIDSLRLHLAMLSDQDRIGFDVLDLDQLTSIVRNARSYQAS